ncbi:MAG TPA: GntR family transcriptional regulator [Candidatus Aquilonibacter sp.]|nr:GntR family transcriptional regulator [Candidatus Aquilonibacter sp.]
MWFARGSGVTLREQLVTQVILGILSGDLAPGQRLPSTRELARRFRLHPNTASAGYKQLEREEWVEFRRGSGVYVHASKPQAALAPTLALDQLIAELFRSARGLSLPLAIVRSRLSHWIDLQPPDHFLLIEPNEELRRILLSEIGRVVTLPVKGIHPEHPDLAHAVESCIPAALPSQAKAIGPALRRGADPLILRVNSVPKSLAPWLPAPTGSLVGVASRWPGFLKLGRNVLAAAGFTPEGLLIRDARKPGWQRGLSETAAVACDSVTAGELPKGARAIIFPLLSEAAVNDLRRYDEFVRTPLLFPQANS